MDEKYLLNTIKYLGSSRNQEFQNIWSKRKDLCKIELIKRWTKELQEKDIEAKTVDKTVNEEDLYKNFPNRNQIIDMILK